MADGELQVQIRGGRVEAPAPPRRRRGGGRVAALAAAAASDDGSDASGLEGGREAGDSLHVVPPEKGRQGGGGGGRLELYFSAPAERALWWDALERAVQVRRPGGGVCAGGSLFSGWVAGVAAVAPGGPLGGGAGREGQRRVLGAQWRRARAAGASREAKPRARPPRSDAEQF